MGAFQVEAILPAVKEAFASPGEGWCATIEVVGTENAWVQVMKHTLNISYPLAAPPALGDVLATLPKAEIASWEAKQFVTVTFADAEPRTVATVVDGLLTRLFKLRDYAVNSHVEDLH